MKSRLYRKAGVTSLVVSLFFFSITPLLLTISASAQTQDQEQNGAAANAKEDTSSSATKKKPPEPKKPLAENEDPAMIGKRNINKGFTGWLGGSMEKEMALGRQIDAEILQQVKLVDDPVVTEYVNRVGQNIALHSDVKVPVTIRVIDSDEVNAFAIPGGYLFVNRGLIIAADNEAELAGVMAHELGHVAARHAMENAGKSKLMNYGMLAGIIFGGGIVSPILYNGGGFLEGLMGMKFSRNAEEEADRLGTQYLYAAGYDPTGMATMFEKLAAENKKKTKGFAKLLMDHPDSLQRRESSLSLVARFPEREEYVISSSEFIKVKEHLLRITNAKNGVKGDIEDTDSDRPTLKKRQPEPDSSNPEVNNDKKDEGPPKLIKRNEPQPTPTPTPVPD